jgi:Double zinc ribbon
MVILMTDNPLKCQKCGSPVTPGVKFCESCGAKIEAGQVCSQCGAPLTPGVKFCESCGKPTAAASAAPVETPPAAEKTPPVALAPETLLPAGTPAPVNEVRQPEAKPETVPEERPAAPPAPAAVAPAKETVKETPKTPGPKKPIPRTTLIIAGIIILALLGAAVFFVVLPMMSGSGTTPLAPSGQVAMPTAAAGPSATSAPYTAGGEVTFTAGPTQVPPTNRALVIDVEKNAITHIITVTFQGGEGQYGVRELAVTLTRADGTVETKSFKPEYRGTFTTLLGSEKADHVEITANFYNGESYKVVDKVFEYQKRVGSS